MPIPVTFSLVVPVHDVRPYLAACLDSLLEQSFADFEILAVDDASTDGSSELLDDYAARDARLHVQHLSENVGLGRARNAGMQRAGGRYLLFVDSDDSLAPGALAAIAARLVEADDPDVLVFDYVRTLPSGGRSSDLRSAELVGGDPAAFRLQERPRFLDLFPVVWNKAYRLNFLRKHGFEFPVGFYEDLPFTYPVLFSAERIATLDRVCYLYRQRSGNILRSADRRQLDFFTQFDRVFDFVGERPQFTPWRAPLFDRLTRHAPWILERSERVSPALRREFFAAASTSFRRNRPPDFVAPTRSSALKIRLIEHGDYRAFRAAQLVNLTKRRTVGLVRTASPTHAPDDARWRDPEQYFAVPAAAAALLDEQDGSVQAQHEALDAIVPYLELDGRFASATGTLPPQVTEPFLDAVTALVRRIDAQVVREHSGVSEQVRQALLVGIKGEPPPPPRLRTDRRRGLQRISYYLTAADPDERLTVAGRAVRPVHAKTRAISYFGRVLLRQRIVWLPESATMTLAGIDVRRLAVTPADAGSFTSRLRRARALAGGASRPVLGTVFSDTVTRAVAHRPAARERFANAWLLIDRDTEAQDNAEHLYRYLRSARPDINAWFVLSRTSADWDRLEAEGFRLLVFGSREHYVALLHCVHLLSSQVDTYVNQPFWQHALGTPRWRFTFLQHGVTQNDLSRWINDKPIDLVLTATPDERHDFVADETPYVLTSLDVSLTGFARHDRLLELGRAAQSPRTVLVMPTWRQRLLGPKSGGNRRALRADFWASDFAAAWREVLESRELRRLCERTGWELTFVPHPNLQDYLDDCPLPDYVRTQRFRDVDVQQVLADAAVLVTDYSSLAFEAAYLQRPVVYYQFDRDTFFAGSHVVRRGQWSYERQGFGPVTTDAAAAVAAIARTVDDTVDPIYAERAEQCFPYRDGRCCARSVAAIEALRTPAAVNDIVQPVMAPRDR